jgi:hypothetical protein
LGSQRIVATSKTTMASLANTRAKPSSTVPPRHRRRKHSEIDGSKQPPTPPWRHWRSDAWSLGHRLPHHQSTTAQQANIQTSRRRPRHHEAASTPPPQTKPPPRSRRCETPSPPWGTPAAQQAAAPQHAGHPRRRRQTRTTAARSAKPVCNEHVCMYDEFTHVARNKKDITVDDFIIIEMKK